MFDDLYHWATAAHTHIYRQIDMQAYTYRHTHTYRQIDMQAYTYRHIHTCIQAHACMHACMHGWPLDFEDTRLLGKLAIPVCRHLFRHSCIVFTQHPQSQLRMSVYISMNKTGTLKPSVTIICDIVLAQPPMGSRTVSIFPICVRTYVHTHVRT